MLKPVLIISFFVGFSLNSLAAQFYFPSDDELVKNFGRCITPNRERALCIFLEDCKYLYNVLITSPLRDADKNYLRRSQCGYRNGKVLICCPERYREADPGYSTTSKPIVEHELLPKPGKCGSVLSTRIYGGNVTKIDEYPWMALIEYSKSGGAKGHHCGGSLINTRYVVTASHCVNGKGLPADWKLSGVRLGEWDTTTNPDCELDIRNEKDCAPAHIDIPVERTIPHPQYIPNSRNQLNDIALVRLATPVTYSEFVKPICLPFDTNLRSATFEGVTMDVAGWGKTETVSASALKLKASVDGVPLNECSKVYISQTIELDQSQMCAGGNEGVDSCRGDSGGPLIGMDYTSSQRSYYFLAGVVSFGPTPCGLAGWPGVYTRVGNFVDWIKQNVEA